MRGVMFNWKMEGLELMEDPYDASLSMYSKATIRERERERVSAAKKNDN